MDAVFEQPVETDKYWADDKQRTAEVLQADTLWMEARPGQQQADRQHSDSTTQERMCASDRPMDRYWTESRHPERQWTVDRHTQRQIDRKIEKQWVGGRKIDRSWSENRSADMQPEQQWSASRKPERQAQMLQLAQRPSPPYPSERTPSPNQETDPLKGSEGAAPNWHQPEPQGERQMFSEAAVGLTEGWRGSGGGRAALCVTKPDPPPQASKQHLPKPRQRYQPENSESLAGVFARRCCLGVYLEGKRSSEPQHSFFYLCLQTGGKQSRR